MNTELRQRIGRAFAGAEHYDRHAGIQRRIALQLAERIAALDLPAQPRILEIGCGTGFLTEALAAHGIDGEWLVTDISAQMLARCRARMGDTANLRYAVVDGEHLGPVDERGFDLICSSLTFQWFEDIDGALGRLIGHLAPGGDLIFTTLAAETFAEWRAAHAAEHLESGTRELPTAAQLRAMHPHRQRREHVVERHVEAHGSASRFLSELKAIGAATPHERHRPLAPGALRRVMANFEQAGALATYEVVTCHYGLPSPSRA